MLEEIIGTEDGNIQLVAQGAQQGLGVNIAMIDQGLAQILAAVQMVGLDFLEGFLGDFVLP